MNLWRLHIRPSSEQGADPVEFCLQQGIVGIGWPVSGHPATKDEYWNLGQKEYGDRGWRQAAGGLLRKMQVGDLVWFRSTMGVYYVGRITGEWQYGGSKEHARADIVNARPAEVYPAGEPPAGKIIASFRPPATLQQIADDTALKYSMLLFNRLAGREEYAVNTSTLDVFQLLSDVDLEDLVGLYLQAEHGYYMIPSSRARKNDTIFYEYQLRSRVGQNAYVQVKSGGKRIDLDNYNRFPDRIYLFSPAGYTGEGTAQTIPLERGTLEQFMHLNRDLMPDAIRVWLDYADAHSGELQ